MTGLGVAICSYIMLGIWMYVGQAKQLLEVGTKKIKTQHKVVTSRITSSSYPLSAWLVTSSR